MDTDTAQVNTTSVPATPEKAKKKGPVPIIEGLLISAPYTDWDVKNFSIGVPIPGTSQNGAASFHTCRFTYKYPCGTVQALQVELPNQPGTRARSVYGFAEVLEYLSEKKLAELGPDYKRKTTGKYYCSCSLDPRLPVVKTLLNIFRDIYEKSLHHMYMHGAAEGMTGILGGEQEYPVPEGNIGPSKKAGHLKYPVRYSQKTLPSGKMGPVDLEGPVKIGADVRKSGPFAVEIVDKEAKPILFDDLEGQGFNHVPLLVLQSLYVGAKNKIRIGMDSTIIDEILPARVNQQASSLATMRIYDEEAKKHALGEAKDAFAFGDEEETAPANRTDDTEEQENDDQEEDMLPETIPVRTAATTPLSPPPKSNPVQRVQERTRLVAGSPSRTPTKLP